jgi:hypothetical protein
MSETAEMNASLRMGRGHEFARLPAPIIILVGLICLAIAGIYAYSIIFSQFAFYDDEGFMMTSVRGFLEGHALYDKVFTWYGPFYYFYKWILHGLGQLPLSHDLTGLLCLIHWLAASTILAAAVTA